MCTSSEDRAARVESLVQQLSGTAETVVRQMAEELADLPEEELFGQIEHRLRQLALQLSCEAQAAAVTAKKRGT